MFLYWYWVFDNYTQLFIDTIQQGTQNLLYISIHNTKVFISVIQHHHYNKINCELYLTYCKMLNKQLNVIEITLVGVKFHKK